MRADLVRAAGHRNALVPVIAPATTYLRCPMPGCPWRVEVTDHGDAVELNVTEAGIQWHLAVHTVSDWIRAVQQQQAVVAVQEQWLAAAGLCIGCGSPGDTCRLMRGDQRKCCPDCTH